jgi:acetyl-CoA carboxylase biotin carboxyl carrier protein
MKKDRVEEQGRMAEDNLKELRELVDFVKANGIAEFEMEKPDLKVRLKFAGAAGAVVAPSAPAPAPAAAPVTLAAAADPYAGMHMVKSPIVGTFYAAPAPEAEPFVKVGDQVSVGTVLCIVEAMKLMNEIESDAAGEIVKVFVEPGHPVEFGQPLFAVK